MDIKEIVDNKEWQDLRESLKGTWNTTLNVYENLDRLEKYIRNGNSSMELKLRRVHNYLGALRGLDKKYPQIKIKREKIKLLRGKK